MSDLNEDARRLLELVRDAGAPAEADRARVRSQLAARIGEAAGLGLAAGLGATVKTTVTAASGAGTTAGALGAGAVTAKLIGAALIVSATVGVGAAVHHTRQAALARRAAAEKIAHVEPARRPVADVAAPVRAPSLAPAPAREAARLPPTASPPKTKPFAREAAPVKAPADPIAPCPPAAPTAAAAPRPAAAAPPPAAAAPRPAAVPAAAAAPAAAANRAGARSAVDEEVRLVHEGLLARRSGQPARALELLNRHASLYPQGVLAEERDAERALALADLGRTAEARAAIDAFLRAHPDSPLAAGLRDRARHLD